MRRNELPLCASSLSLCIPRWYWRQAVRQTGELKARQAGRQTSRQTGRQTERHTGAQGFKGQFPHSSRLSSHHREFLYAQLLQTIQRLLLLLNVLYLHTPPMRHTGWQYWTLEQYCQPVPKFKVLETFQSAVRICICWTNIKIWVRQKCASSVFSSTW